MEPANVFEGYFLKSMIQKSQDEFDLSMDIVVADMGYLGSDRKKRIARTISYGGPNESSGEYVSSRAVYGF
jgi:hypothetical protein